MRQDSAGLPIEILTEPSDVNLLICGATDVSEIEKKLIGSVAEGIIQHAKYDVLIVR
ncbi:universal stress protein [Lysinibacillus telephonicus]|uniref:universal stress protein n=1 Tax=Lysinibacillus telephonicus TaxID=1714840 RepID=UPI003BA1A1EC